MICYSPFTTHHSPIIINILLIEQILMLLPANYELTKKRFYTMKQYLFIKKWRSNNRYSVWLKGIACVTAIFLFCTIDFAQQPPPPLPPPSSLPATSVPPVLDTIHKSARRARRDSIIFAKHVYFTDSSFSPRKATIRSALLPGWGQIYNKQYWKLPFVYAAIGITAGFYISNRATYREFRNAYILEVVDSLPSTDPRIPAELQAYSVNSLKFNRDNFRKYSDLSIIAFFLAWGVNVIDATVTAHLKQFDVSDNLTLKINPNMNFLKQPGLTFTLAFKDKNKSPTLVSR